MCGFFSCRDDAPSSRNERRRLSARRGAQLPDGGGGLEILDKLDDDWLADDAGDAAPPLMLRLSNRGVSGKHVISVAAGFFLPSHRPRVPSPARTAASDVRAPLMP